MYESNGDTCTSCGSVSATKSSRAWASAISCATGKATRRTRTGAATTTWIRSRAAAVSRRAASSRRRRFRSGRQRPVERSAGVDDRQDDRSRHQADLHRRDPGRVCDAARRRLQPGRVLHVPGDAQLHRGRAVADERHGARQRPVRRGQSSVLAFAACQSADAQRTYRAFTVDLRRRLANGWMGDISYTWSRFEGNFDLDYSPVAVFNTSSFIQDGPGTNVEDPNRFGPLFEDRPHVFKVFTSYAATSRLTASRLPARAERDAVGRARPRLGRRRAELSRARRQPPQSDLGQPRFDGGLPAAAGSRASVSFEARLLNVFDNQTRLSTDAQQYLDLRRCRRPVLRSVPAAESVLRNRQRLRAAAAPLPRRGRQLLTARTLDSPTVE